MAEWRPNLSGCVAHAPRVPSHIEPDPWRLAENSRSAVARSKALLARFSSPRNIDPLAAAQNIDPLAALFKCLRH